MSDSYSPGSPNYTRGDDAMKKQELIDAALHGEDVSEQPEEDGHDYRFSVLVEGGFYRRGPIHVDTTLTEQEDEDIRDALLHYSHHSQFSTLIVVHSDDCEMCTEKGD